MHAFVNHVLVPGVYNVPSDVDIGVITEIQNLCCKKQRVCRCLDKILGFAENLAGN